MLYNLFAPYAHKMHIANLFTYISFRSVLAVLLSLGLSIYMGPKLINYLRTIYKRGQPIRNEGPQSHLEKIGTPTMGGIMILGSSLISILLLANLANAYVWICIFVMVSYGALGFVDDYAKVTQYHHQGVNGRTKLIVQLLVSIIVFASIFWARPEENYTHLALPFIKNMFIDLGYFYLPFIVIVIVGASNAVNLTDGLDGLAIGTVAITTTSFAIIAYIVGNSIYSHYLQIPYISQAGELTVICAAIIGSSLGFLWYNAKPAAIFMGDTGSLALGGLLGTISVITKHELILCIIGGIFVIETLSVIIQVYYFKKSNGKRIFLMAPLHHHFEKKGWPETKIVIRFWILAVIFALIGLSSLKLR